VRVPRRTHSAELTTHTRGRPGAKVRLKAAAAAAAARAASARFRSPLRNPPTRNAPGGTRWSTARSTLQPGGSAATRSVRGRAAGSGGPRPTQAMAPQPLPRMLNLLAVSCLAGWSRCVPSRRTRPARPPLRTRCPRRRSPPCTWRAPTRLPTQWRGA
jgi:hypothetical protein